MGYEGHAHIDKARHRHQSCRSTSFPRKLEGRGPQCQLVDSREDQARKAVARRQKRCRRFPSGTLVRALFAAQTQQPWIGCMCTDTSSGPGMEAEQIDVQRFPTTSVELVWLQPSYSSRVSLALNVLGFRLSLVFTSSALAVQCNYERNYALVKVGGHCYGNRYSRIHILLYFQQNIRCGVTSSISTKSGQEQLCPSACFVTNANDLAAGICILRSWMSLLLTLPFEARTVGTCWQISRSTTCLCR